MGINRELEVKLGILREEVEYLRSYEAIWKGDSKEYMDRRASDPNNKGLVMEITKSNVKTMRHL